MPTWRTRFGVKAACEDRCTGLVTDFVVMFDTETPNIKRTFWSLPFGDAVAAPDIYKERQRWLERVYGLIFNWLRMSRWLVVGSVISGGVLIGLGYGAGNLVVAYPTISSAIVAIVAGKRLVSGDPLVANHGEAYVMGSVAYAAYTAGLITQPVAICATAAFLRQSPIPNSPAKRTMAQQQKRHPARRKTMKVSLSSINKSKNSTLSYNSLFPIPPESQKHTRLSIYHSCRVRETIQRSRIQTISISRVHG